MSNIEDVFARLLNKLEKMSASELDIQLKKHEGAGGPTVDQFLDDYFFTKSKSFKVTIPDRPVFYSKSYKIAGQASDFYYQYNATNLECAA